MAAQFGFHFKTAKANFFNPDTVLKKLDAAKARVLGKFGARVRLRAQGNIRKRKKVSDPGQGPTNRTGLLKRFIFYFYDRARDGVIIGPTILNGREYRDGAEMLEYGGTTIRRFFLIHEQVGEGGRDEAGRFIPKGEDGRRTKVTIRSSRRAKPGRVKYEPRPYMNPALEAELPAFLKMWQDQVA